LISREIYGFSFCLMMDFFYKYHGLKLKKVSSSAEYYGSLSDCCNYYYDYNKIYQFENGQFTEIVIPRTTYDKCAILDVFKDAIGNYWVGTNNYCSKALSLYDGNEWLENSTSDFFDSELITKSESIYKISQSNSGNLLFLTGSSIIQNNGQEWKTLLDFIDATGQLIISYNFYQDTKNNIWFGFDKLYRYNGKKTTKIDLDSYPKTGEFTRVLITYFEDNEGVMWVGTSDGLFKIN
jgi:ligand-binding sensor domain-containing protein